MNTNTKRFSKKKKDPVGEYLRNADIVLTEFADSASTENLRSELTRLQKMHSSAASTFRDTGSENLKIAVVGSFSCGKSSFINSILEDEVAPVEIKPMTHGVTSFVYGEEEKYDADGKAITRKQYQEFVQDAKNETQHFIVHYPCERLKKLEFMDSPGFGSVSKGDEAQSEQTAERDNQLSDESIARADVVFFLSNITEGVIPHDAFKRLKDICDPKDGAANPNRRIYIILTWGDRKTASQREDIRNSIVSLCESEKLNICDYRVYSSQPIEKIKSEKNQQFFAQAREELFSTVRDLQIVGAELMSYRRGFDDLVFKLQLRHFLEDMRREVAAIKSALGSPAAIRKVMQKKFDDITKKAIDYVCGLLEEKYASCKSMLIYDEKHTIHDDVVSVVIPGDFVTISAGEIHALGKMLATSAQKHDLPWEGATDALKNFLSYETSPRPDPDGAYYEVQGYSNDGLFQEGSLADAYLKICASLLKEAGGPWKEYLFGADERSAFVNKKQQEIKSIFDRKFRSEISKAFSGERFAGAISHCVIEPQIKSAEKRIRRLDELDEALVYKETVAAADDDVPDIPDDISVDDILNML